VGSDSKLPRLHPASSTLQRLLLLLHSLEWRGFVGRFLGMSLRGMLILSTYSSASMVAARAGTASLAAHQVRLAWGAEAGVAGCAAVGVGHAVCACM
jgi:hypothetical protein